MGVAPLLKLKNTEQNINFISTQSFDLHEIEESGNVTSKYHLQINGHVYYIGLYVYFILNQIKLGKRFNAIWQALNDFHQQEAIFSKEELAEAINQNIVPLFEEKEKKASHVKSLFQVLNPSSIKPLISPLAFLFQDKVFKLVFTVLLMINGGYYLLIKTIAPAVPSIGHTSMKEGLIYILGIACCLLFHEIGHAVAAIAKDITPKKIGFGIYFIFPALYTDLTDIWRLNSKDRIIINLGGIYFQLLINSFLIFWLFQLPTNTVLSYFLYKIILLNIIISIYNVNPFFKFDGYWIYSDFFDIPNLRQRSNKLIGQCFFAVRDCLKGQPFKIVTAEAKNYSLITYAILYICFMAFIWSFILRFVINTYTELFKIITNFETFNISSTTDWTSLAPLIVCALLPWLIAFFRINKYLKTKRND